MTRHRSRRAIDRGIRSAFAVERLESRVLFDITVTIPEGGSVSFVGPGGTLYNIQFKRCEGNVVFKGDNLEQSTLLNGTPIVKGDITQIAEINVTSALTIPGVTQVVLRGKGNSAQPDFGLGKFVSDVALDDVTLRTMQLQGKLDAPGIAMLNIGSFQNANVQYAGYSGAPQATIMATSATDSTFTINPGVKMLSLNSFTATTPGNATAPGTSDFTTPSLGTLKIKFDCSADFNISGPVTSASVGGALDGRWNIRGATNFLSAHTFKPSFTADFGPINNLNVGGTYSGYITTPSIGHASMGNMLNGNLWLTQPYAANSWSLGTLNTHEIVNSQIMSYGNLGSISTMFTYGSFVAAGVNPSYTFGQSLGTSDFIYPSVIKSFYSDCPMKNAFHYANSYVSASDVMSVQIGTIQTQNNGIPEGFAAKLIGKLKAGIKSGAINLANINTEADVAMQLGAAGITSADLGDLKFLLTK